MYVPPKGCPRALVNPVDDRAGMELFIGVFIIRIKEAREAIYYNDHASASTWANKSST